MASTARFILGDAEASREIGEEARLGSRGGPLALEVGEEEASSGQAETMEGEVMASKKGS